MQIQYLVQMKINQFISGAQADDEALINTKWKELNICQVLVFAFYAVKKGSLTTKSKRSSAGSSLLNILVHLFGLYRYNVLGSIVGYCCGTGHWNVLLIILSQCSASTLNQ